jgi:hypothetical protein
VQETKMTRDKGEMLSFFKMESVGLYVIFSFIICHVCSRKGEVT